jgi:phosphoglycerate dehydrogenase-like enzyme
MTNLNLAFLGYRQQWELDWLTEHVSAAVAVEALPCDPMETLGDRGADLAAQAHILVAWGYPLAGIHQSPGKLKLVQTLGAGTNGVPKVELQKLGIPVAGHGGANSVAVAELTVLLIVAGLRRLTGLVNDLKQGRYNVPAYRNWEQLPDLVEKRVGIVGFGHIGQAVARRLAGWECEIVYCDQLEIDPRRQSECNATPVSLEELLRTSDVVSLHTPLTDKTRGMVGAEQLALMKPTSVLVNTCRGPVVDEAALISALQKGTIAGAGLDVTEVEPIAPDNPLLLMENVFLTPHLAGLSVEARRKALTFAAENANRLTAGLPPLGVVDPFE